MMNAPLTQITQPDLTWTEEVGADTAHLYQKVAKIVPPNEWPFYAPYVREINRLKKVRNAVILAHNYQTAEIYNCVADYVGDSLQLAKLAAETDADIIVQGGVHFMAETSKLMSPEKTVLIPDSKAGCSLADSITGADVRKLKAENPGVPVVTYVNTSAEVKAESDICCTSSNVVDIVKGLNAPRVYVLPDKYLAAYVARHVSCEILTWEGRCEVHERFNGAEIRSLREAHPGALVLAHPECPPDVIDEADFTGSTARMAAWVKDKGPKDAIMITECSMADNVALEAPETNFIRPCNLCPHMKRITLPKILNSLITLEEEIVIDPAIAERARQAVDRMVQASR